MKQTLSALAVRYRIGLESHLRRGRRHGFDSARLLGQQALGLGIRPIELAKLHEKILVAHILPRHARNQMVPLIKRAGAFLAVAITQTPQDHSHAAREMSALKRAVGTLSVRTMELAASNHELNSEIIQRKAAENALKESKEHYAESLERSRILQEQMRRLSRRLLSAHEDERRRISRELHDVIAQTLTGINLRLSTFAVETSGLSKSLHKNILKTQRMVEHSVNIVHQFARELRPTVLDDLGLIPALHSFLKDFTVRTGIHARLTAPAAVERLDMARRTVLFRVALEALTNVARHSGASEVEVNIQLVPRFVTMRIKDDGKSFDVEAELRRNRGTRLGLVGMRERVEMLGGVFAIESMPGKGVTIVVRLSVRKNSVRRAIS